MANYDSVEKKAKDLAKKGYALGKVVKTDAKTGNGVKWSTETNLGDDVSTKITTKFNTEFAAVDKLEFSSSGNVTVKLVNSSLVSGLEVSVEGAGGKNGSDSAKVGLEYGLNDLTLSGEFDLVKKGGKADALFSYQDFAVGGGASFSAKGLGDWKALAAYVTSDSRFSVATSNLTTFDLRAFHNLRKDFTLGGSLSYSGKGASTFDIAGKWVVDSDYTVQAKVNSSKVLTASVSQKLSSRVSVTASQEIGLADMKSKKAGFELSFC